MTAAQEKKLFLELLSLNSKKIILVEGKKDVRALESLGCLCVHEIKGELYQFCERIAQEHKKVIILTDTDAAGERLYKIVKQYLIGFGVVIDKKLREQQLKAHVSHIEGL